MVVKSNTGAITCRVVGSHEIGADVVRLGKKCDVLRTFGGVRTQENLSAAVRGQHVILSGSRVLYQDHVALETHQAPG